MIEIPQSIVDLSVKKCETKTGFAEKVEALVTVNRIRKTMKLELEPRVIQARDEYRRGADILKVSDGPWAEIDERLRSDLNRYIEEEDCPPEQSVMKDQFDGAIITARTVVVVTDLEELVRGIAEGKAPIDFVQPNMPAIREKTKQLGAFFKAPGIEQQKETKVGLRGRVEGKNE